MWEFYLAASECAFRHFGLMNFQLQLAKRVDTVPLTRDYIANREATLRRGRNEQWQPCEQATSTLAETSNSSAATVVEVET